MTSTSTINSADTLGRIAREVAITSPATFRSRTRQSNELPGADIASPAQWKCRATLRIRDLLYREYFLGVDEDLDKPFERMTIIDQEDVHLGRALRDANTGTGFWDPAWRIIAAGKGFYEISKDGIQLRARRDELRFPDESAEEGALVAVHFPKDRPFASMGHYTAIGNAGPPAGLIVRIYLDVAPSDAPLTMKVLSTELNAIRTRFLLKALNHPLRYARPDSMVLYLERCDLDRWCEPLRRVIRGALTFRLPFPCFTKPLASGVSLAEDPFPPTSIPESFGQHRCRLIASGLVSAWTARAKDALPFIVDSLVAAGVDPDLPYLNPGSADCYEDLEVHS